MSAKGGRIESLDSLRGIAAICVICSHINLDYFYGGFTTPYKNTLLHVFYDGEAAVVFFFVLSGFVLSHKYISAGSEGVKKISYPSFIISRLFRILPLFWVVLIITALCAAHFSHQVQNIPPRSWTFWWYKTDFNLKGFLQQASLIYTDPVLGHYVKWIGGNQYIPQCWSLDIELMLSILVPVLILMAVNRPGWLIFFAMVLACMFNVYPYLIHFVMGILLALYLPRVNAYLQNKSSGFIASLLASGIFLYSWRYAVAPHFGRSSVLQFLLFSDISILFFVGLGVCIIMASVLNSNRIKFFFETPVMKLIGKVSYGIYLCHTMMLAFFTPVVIYWLNQCGITSTAVVLMVSFLVTTAGSVAIAFVLHHLVELKFIALGKKVAAYVRSFSVTAIS